MSWGTLSSGFGALISSQLAFPVTANAGMVSDEELEQMLDSGQSEVFVSNVSGHSHPSSVGFPSLSPGLCGRQAKAHSGVNYNAGLIG